MRGVFTEARNASIITYCGKVGLVFRGRGEREIRARYLQFPLFLTCESRSDALLQSPPPPPAATESGCGCFFFRVFLGVGTGFLRKEGLGRSSSHPPPLLRGSAEEQAEREALPLVLDAIILKLLLFMLMMLGFLLLLLLLRLLAH